MDAKQLIGRKGLAQLLSASESSTRNWQKRGLIRPAASIDGRDVFSVSDAVALKAYLEAQRGDGKAA
jgi:DNA-binding transcriptional MerR regulator